MLTLKNSRSFYILLLFSFVFSVASAQDPFFGKHRSGAKSASSSRPAFGGRVTSPDTSGFGGEPGVVWERLVKEEFPESIGDGVYNLTKLTDGTFAVSGSMVIAGPPRNIDGFVMKVNAEGRVIWKRRLGTETEDFYPSICATPDGGMIATGPFSIDTTRGLPVVKLNAAGEIDWQVTLTGIAVNDFDLGLTLSDEGGYLIAGKTETTFYCPEIASIRRDSVSNVLIKIDGTGNLIWVKNYYIGIMPGPNGSTETVVLNVENGYLISNTFQIFPQSAACTSSVFSEAAVLMKVDNNGNLLWLKEYGGSGDDLVNSLVLLADSKIMMLGSTTSKDGDLEGIHTDSLQSVAWQVVINDTGKIISNRIVNLLPGTDNFFYRGYVKNDSTHVLVGDAYIYDQYNFLGYVGFVLQFDENGVEQWRFVSTDRAIVGLGAINDHEWMAGGLAGIDETGWFGKLGAISNITGTVFYDFNKNNFKDPGEPYVNKFLVTSTKPGYSRSSVALNGWFRNDLDTGSYTTTVQLVNNYYIAVPASKQTTFTSLFQKDTVHFALQPVAGKRDLSLSLLPVTGARPGFNAQYQIKFSNKGTDTILNGAVVLLKDPRANFLSAVPAPSLVQGDSLVWLVSSFKPFDERSISIEVKLAAPPALNNGDTLHYAAAIVPATGIGTDLTPQDDSSFLTQLVTGSYDPNDKQENVAGKIPLAKITSGEDIQYVIRFQNTGTDTAFTVRITDTLDAKLNWNSLQMTGASHTYKMKVEDGNKITWIFDKILLPDSNINEPLSHGYIAFRIKAKTNLAAGDYFQNKAFIYFDYNLPIVTNTATTVVSSATVTGVRNVRNDEMKIVALPNPSNGNLYMKISGKLTGKFEYSIVDLYGRVLQTQTIERNGGQDTQLVPIQLNRIGAGVYYIVLRQKEKLWQQKIIVQ